MLFGFNQKLTFTYDSRVNRYLRVGQKKIFIYVVGWGFPAALKHLFNPGVSPSNLPGLVILFKTQIVLGFINCFCEYLSSTHLHARFLRCASSQFSKQCLGVVLSASESSPLPLSFQQRPTSNATSSFMKLFLVSFLILFLFFVSFIWYWICFALQHKHDISMTDINI